jgi:hypothetical protein
MLTMPVHWAAKFVPGPPLKNACEAPTLLVPKLKVLARPEAAATAAV